MQPIRAFLALFASIAAPAIVCVIIWGIIMGGSSVKSFYYNTKDSIIKEYGLFGSDPIHIKDDERRERIMAEQRKEYEELMAKNGGSTSNAASIKQADIASNEELLGSPEIAKTVDGWALKAAQNPPMSPFAQATAFLTSARNSVNDGVEHNKLTEQDIAVITKALLSNDLNQLARLDQIYSRKDLVIVDEEGNTKRLYERPNGKLAVLNLNKQLSDELEAEKAASN